ncbi:hypothetical protein [Burkholderia pyrrocinia]|uniref:hypothetical protein n=1 Tax=Burkholderia pyrrocinia TaxID=60550 RepID=UPI00158BC818|nr:hypothetical protein [Burkholderia pyrrocinia]
MGAATGSLVSPFVLAGIDSNGTALDAGQLAVLNTVAALAGGGAAGVFGENATAGATWADNEALNNDALHLDKVLGAVSAFWQSARSAIPGVHMADQAQAAASAGNYGMAAALALGSVADAGLSVLTLGEGAAVKQAVGKVLATADTITVYRAVSPEEFNSIMQTGKFSFTSGANEMKQFGFNLNEVMAYANTAPEYAAIIKANIPASVIGKFGVSYSIDPFIFKSGVLSVMKENQLNIFNSFVTNVGHAY